MSDVLIIGAGIIGAACAWRLSQAGLSVRVLDRAAPGGQASQAALGPHPNHPVYAATKAGVLNFTRSLTHLEEESKIRVNCICPWLVATDLARHAAELMTGEER